MLTETNLNQFTGTTCYYRYMLGLKLLPGLCSKCVTREVPDCIELLTETIYLTHDAGRHGDADCHCTTCDLMKIAKKMVGALRL